MLPPNNRLKKEKDIKRALVSKSGAKSGPLVCKTAANKLTSARFCFIVSKKISNKAVVRNRVKRRLREAIACSLPEIKSGIDCVLIALPGLEAMSYQEIREKVSRALTKGGLLIKSKSNYK